MKKNYKVNIVIVIIEKIYNMRRMFLLSSFLMLTISCGGNIFYELENDIHEEITKSGWEEQLNYALNKERVVTKTNNNNSFFLEGYTYKRKINTQSEIFEVIDQLFSDNSYTVFYTDKINFEIVPLQTVSQRSIELNFEDPIEYIRSNIVSHIEVGMDLVDLKWNFNGKNFYSTAIVSKKHNRIIYDHIGFMVLENPISETKTAGQVSQNTNIIRLKSRSESNGGTIVKEFSLNDSLPQQNHYGIYLWEYVLSCFSYFNENGILISRNLNSYSDSVFPYSCQANIETISGDIDSSGFHEFSYGYIYGVGNLSLTWSGNGFSASGGGTSRTGTEVHRP